MTGKAVGLLIVLLGIACLSDFPARLRASGAGSQQLHDSPTSSSLDPRSEPGRLLEAIYRASRQESSKKSLRHPWNRPGSYSRKALK